MNVEHLKTRLGEHFQHLAIDDPKDNVDRFINERLELFARQRTGCGWEAIQAVHKLKELAKLSKDEIRIESEVYMRMMGMTWK